MHDLVIVLVAFVCPVLFCGGIWLGRRIERAQGDIDARIDAATPRPPDLIGPRPGEVMGQVEPRKAVHPTVTPAPSVDDL